MNKLGAAAFAAAALTGGAAYGVSQALFTALISRNFKIPKAVSKFITEKDDKNPMSSLKTGSMCYSSLFL